MKKLGDIIYQIAESHESCAHVLVSSMYDEIFQNYNFAQMIVKRNQNVANDKECNFYKTSNLPEEINRVISDSFVFGILIAQNEI